jgi:ferredoxin-NADP reductase
VASPYRVELLAREMCGDDVLTCRLGKPSGYHFEPGQWFRLTIDTPQGPDTRTFSHASAPSDETLDMTTRLSPSAFKVALAALEPGAVVEIVGPGGRLRLPADADRVCFLAGGVGITPVRSMLRGAVATGRTFADALLLYANRDESCVPFGEEFERMADLGVRMVSCLEHAPEGWDGERGFITAETIRRHLDPDDGRPFLVAGPPKMVAAMERVLDDLDVEAQRRIIERFGAAS